MENPNHQNPHAIIAALRLQGHVIPAVHLAIKLASNGFTVTFVNTEATHDEIVRSSGQKRHENEKNDINIFDSSGLDIRYRTVSDGFPIGFDRLTNHEEYHEAHLGVLPGLVDELVGSIVRNDTSVSVLIVDTFYTWTTKIAKKYNLISVSFWTQTALALSLYYYKDLLKVNGHYASKDNRQDTIDYIPGIKSVEPKDLISFLQESDDSNVLHRFLNEAFEDVKKVDFILCNTAQELESETIMALQKKQPIYPIGPIFPLGFAKSIVPTSLWSESDCTQWLNSKPNGSVLYVSLGSFALCAESDIDEIALGLALSQVNFIWSLRPNIVSYDQNYGPPGGFLEAVKDRGLVVPWTNQIEVVSHPSIGGFLTHCGWNSILESIWCRVPLLCFPLFTDQPPNRKLVVDDWGVGIDLCDRRERLTRFQVAENVRRLMSGKEAEDLRNEIAKVRLILENATATSGSSQKNFGRFISDVKAKIGERMCV